MKQFSKYVSLAMHKETIAVAIAESDDGEVRYLGEITNALQAIQKLVSQAFAQDGGARSGVHAAL